MNIGKTVLVVALMIAVIISGCTQANAPPADDNQNGTNSPIEPQPEAPAEAPPSDTDTEPETGPTAPMPPAPPVDEPGNVPPQPPVEEPTPPSEPPMEEPAANVKEFDITAKNWEFEPSTITVSKGDTVRLKITSVDVEHGFVLSAFNVNENLKKGQTVDVEFVADRSGSFTFFCNVFCGEGHSGMKGTLVVNEYLPAKMN